MAEIKDYNKEKARTWFVLLKLIEVFSALRLKSGLIISIAKCMSAKELAETLEDVADNLSKYVKERREEEK